MSVGDAPGDGQSGLTTVTSGSWADIERAHDEVWASPGDLVIPDVGSSDGEHYLQLRRVLDRDRDFGQVEVRLGGADAHWSCRVTDPALSRQVFAAWFADGTTLPEVAGVSWQKWRAGDAFEASRRYDIWVHLAAPGTPPLWRASRWQRLVPVMTALVQTPRGRVMVDSLQSGPGVRDIPRFGAIGWTESGHAKWMHTASRGRGWRHVETTVWSPSRLTAYRQGIPPDVLFQVKGSWVGESYMGWWTMLSTATDMDHPALEPVLRRLRVLTSPDVVAHQRRDWARSVSETGWFGELPDAHLLSGTGKDRWAVDPIIATEWEFLHGSPT